MLWAQHGIESTLIALIHSTEPARREANLTGPPARLRPEQAYFGGTCPSRLHSAGDSLLAKQFQPAGLDPQRRRRSESREFLLVRNSKVSLAETEGFSPKIALAP
jgi:hypothetical protein